MNSKAQAPKASESRASSNAEIRVGVQRKGFAFEDNRPEAVTQRKLQVAINNSPRVQQLKLMQRAMAGTSSFVCVIQRQYKAASKQKKQLTQEVQRKWGKAIKDENPLDTAIEDAVDEIIEYSENHRQAMDFIGALSYDEWIAGMELKEAEVLHNECLGVGTSVEAPKEVDPLARTKKAIIKAGKKVTDFSDLELQNIKTWGETENYGWDNAVRTVCDVKAEEQYRLERAKAIADLIPLVEAEMSDNFTANALCMRIWQGSVASAGVTGYFELPDSYSAGDLLGAWQLWQGFCVAVEHSDIDGFSTFRIGNGTAQDKSDRPDIETRKFAFQMNFSLTWKGSEQMMHIGLNGTDNPEYKG